MNLFVKFWNASKELAETPYFTSQFLGGAKADDNLEKFETGVSKKIYKADDLLQIPSYDPNVDLLFIKFYGENRCLNELPALLDIGTCGFHYGSFHGSLKNTEKAIKWDIGKVLKSMSKILMNSPARRETFEKITESDVYLLSYCSHRWCEKCAPKASPRLLFC